MVANSFFISLAKAVVLIIVVHFVLKRLLANRTVVSRNSVRVTEATPPEVDSSVISKQDINSRLIDFVDDIDAESDSSDYTSYEPEGPGLMGDKVYTPYRATDDLADLKRLVDTQTDVSQVSVPTVQSTAVASRTAPEPVCTGGQLMDGVYGYNFDNAGSGFSLVESPPLTATVGFESPPPTGVLSA